MPAHVEMSRPTIRVWSDSATPAEVLRQVEYGMEEEGIPWEKEIRTGMTATDMAYEAAGVSRLEVGVGMDTQRVVLHFAKLKREEPLFSIPARSTDTALRLLGANAARLVKKLPLKPMDRR